MNGAFVITISGKFSIGVSDDARRISFGYQRHLEALLSSNSISSPIRGMVLFPTLLSPEISPMPDYVTYKKDGSVFIATNISYERWVSAEHGMKIDLMAANVVESLRKIRKARLTEIDLQILLSAVEKARLRMHADLRERKAN